MNESIRTIVFVAVAGLIGVVAWATRPIPSAPVTTGETQLFEPFEATDANSFKIVRYDEDEGGLSTFEVAKSGGRWTIPSADNYPADAEEQLKKLAELFVELKPITKVSDSADTHELYGVKEPTDKITGEAKGYGREITIADKSGDPLVRLIVGKEAEGGAAGDAAGAKELHFVRRAGQDPVYVAEISLAALTTKFEDWIERDLLQLNSFDVAKLDLRDYSIVPVEDPTRGGVSMALLRRMDTVVAWDAEKSQWNLDKMTLYQDNQELEGELAEDEELNKEKLDGVKTAVDDLKIIDVDRKPKVLADALKDESIARDRDAMQELFQYGFFLMPGENNKVQILGSNGGLRITMKDGVQYRLNFGNAKSAEKGDSTKLNRYLMVTAEIDESMIPQPDLEPEDVGPETPADEKKDTETNDAEKNDGSAPSVENMQEGEKSDEAQDEAKSEEPKSDDAANKERERIKKENARKLDEWREKRRQAEARVAELNARFGDWFYVVSDDVYKKVQLGRADIVKDNPAAKEEGFGVDAFRSLEKSGIQGKASAPPPSPPVPNFPGQ